MQLQLAIMTSDDTHARTEALLNTHAYFGAECDQIHLLKQEKVCRHALQQIELPHRVPGSGCLGMLALEGGCVT